METTPSRPGQGPPEDPHRKTQRIPWLEPVRLRKPYAITGVGVDIGAGGVGVALPLPLEVGTSVELEMFQGHAIALGHVRWVKPLADGFRVGIQFLHEDWSVIERVHALQRQQG